MFSEYASRFLAQSQSRLLSSQTETNQRRNPLERPRGAGSRASSRYLPRQQYGSPYQGTAGQASRFPFASRLGAGSIQAPLFHSAQDEFREEDDVEEHEREVADFYALQSSRRDFAASKLTESSESGADDVEELERQRPRGIRSSWTGDDQSKDKDTGIGNGKSRLVDVDLASTIDEADELLDQDSNNDPPSLQNLRPIPDSKAPFLMPRETDVESARLNPRPPSPANESFILDVSPADPPLHDVLWSRLFSICVASLFATFILVCLHTSAPTDGKKLGDTIYTMMHLSFHLLGVDTLIAIVVALVWLAILRSFARPLVFGILVAVPLLSTAFALYPFISSFKGSWRGGSIQDVVMRWLSILPALFAVGWTYTAIKSRHSLGRAIELLEFSSRILASSPALILTGFATLAAVVVWSWIWMLMFTRVFLEGHLDNAKSRFLIDTSTWWLGVYFVFVYLWTLGIASGVQRTTTAATVSQWYFHRLVVPAPSSHRVVKASLEHSLTTIFGTICLSSLLSLLVRLPLLLLPSRLAGYIAMAFYSIIPTSVAILTNPLSLTYSAIHSHPLSTAARGLSEMPFISTTSPTTTLTPSQAASSPSQPIHAYHLAKLLLHSTRFISSLAFAFGGWVATARMLQIEGTNYRGSIYAYVVGLIAGAISWGVLGAMESVLGGILDAVIVCYGSETQRGDGVARYCREAGELLGGGEVGLR